MHPPTLDLRPPDEDFHRNAREAMTDSANAISVAWLVSECRRARYQEEQLRPIVEGLRKKGVQPSDD
jgi:hypothetical protein